MWLCLNDAFFSIVHKDCGRDELLVRARRKGDIEKVFPEATVKTDKLADYLYRAVVKRDVIERAMVGELRRINYANFKDSVADERLHVAYLRVWNAMADLQPNNRGSGLLRFPCMMELATQEFENDRVPARPLPSAPIAEIGDLPARAVNALHFANIETVGQLVSMSKAELLRLPNFGRVSLAQIEKRLADFRLSLGMEMAE